MITSARLEVTVFEVTRLRSGLGGDRRFANRRFAIKGSGQTIVSRRFFYEMSDISLRGVALSPRGKGSEKADRACSALIPNGPAEARSVETL